MKGTVMIELRNEDGQMVRHSRHDVDDVAASHKQLEKAFPIADATVATRLGDASPEKDEDALTKQPAAKKSSRRKTRR